MRSHAAGRCRGPSQGKAVRVFGSADLPHSWTDVRDMGRALVALVADESTWGRVWHAPTNAPRTQAAGGCGLLPGGRS